jgi:hypothetical protein
MTHDDLDDVFTEEVVRRTACNVLDAIEAVVRDYPEAEFYLTPDARNEAVSVVAFYEGGGESTLRFPGWGLATRAHVERRLRDFVAKARAVGGD